MTGEPQWQQDQQDAAHAETHRILKQQHIASRVDPSDAMHEVDPETASEWIRGLPDRIISMMSEPGLRVCPHLAGKPKWPQPVYFRSWRPGLRCLKECQPLLGFHAPAGWPCFRCANTPDDPLYIQTYQIGCVAFYFGLCQWCLSKTQAELVGAGLGSE